MTLHVCSEHPSMTPLSIREADATEVITLFARYIRLARRKKTAQNGGGKEVVSVTGTKYIIKSEDKADIKFGG